jgi:hypothetical protein
MKRFLVWPNVLYAVLFGVIGLVCSALGGPGGLVGFVNGVIAGANLALACERSQLNEIMDQAERNVLTQQNQQQIASRDEYRHRVRYTQTIEETVNHNPYLR